MWDNYTCSFYLHKLFFNFFKDIYIFKLILSTHVIRVIPRPGEARDRYNKYARKL
jgi:hypothetical protein